MLEFRILGPLEVLDGGRPIPLAGQKQRALLALLLLDAGRVVSTDRLLEELWSGEPPRTAVTSLQNLVSALRKAIGREHVVTRPPGYLLDVDPRRVDAVRFELLVREAKDADPTLRAELLRRALALFHGEPLADFAYDAFAQAEIARLDELRAGVTEALMEAELALGRHEAVVGELEGLVVRHPHRERLRGQLMLALYRSGRQAEALAAYRDARAALVDGLGIEPSPALQRIHAAILRQEAGLEPAPAAAPDPAHVDDVVRALTAGRLVPVVGPGSDGDLPALLAARFDPPPAYAGALARLAQYVTVTTGAGPLRDELAAVLAAEREPGPVHRFLAGLPAVLRERGAPQPVLVTTAFGRALERAFADAGEALDVVAYVASGRDRGRFRHTTADGDERTIALPNAYADLPLGARPVLVKAYGSVEAESFVASEDDHIGYLLAAESPGALPATLAAALRRSHFLFLGYPVVDWVSRVLLQRLWGDEPPGYRSWAVGGGAPPDRDYWRHRGVDRLDGTAEDYVARVRERLEAGAPA